MHGIRRTIDVIAISLTVLATVVGICFGSPALVTYPAPVGATLSSDYTVQVDGVASPVYRYGQAFTTFDISAPVTVTVTATSVQAINAAVVRPLKLGIKPTISGKTITFTLSEPQNVDVEIDGNTDKPLFISANPIDLGAPKPGDPNVIYYGPGMHDIGAVSIGSDTTVYIAGGAIVTGQFDVWGSHVKITGRGILLERGKLLVLISHEVLLQGIVVCDAPDASIFWTVVPWNSSHLVIDDLKIFPNPQWGQDGMDLVGCKDVEVKNCCIRSVDDCITAKSFGGNVSDYNIHDDILWSSGQDGVEIGFELNCDSVTNIHYHDLDILHYTGCWAAMSIHDIGWGENPGRAKISNIVYENINVEDCPGRLFDIICAPNLGGWGTVDGVTYRNINVLGAANPSLYIQIGADYNNHLGITDPGPAYNPDHTVQNLTFENLQVLGKTILRTSDMNSHIGQNDKNLVFER